MYLRYAFFMVLVVFISSSDAQIIKTKTPLTKSAEYYQWQDVSGGVNYAIWNNGRHRGVRYHIQYVESISKYFSGSITGWYANGTDKNVFVQTVPAGVIRRDSYSWAYAVEPTVGISFFKNKVHELSIFAGVVGGISKTEEWGSDINVFLDPSLGLGIHPVVQRAKAKFMYGTNACLQYQLRLGKFVIAANVAGLNLDTGPYHTYHGLQIGYMLNKPLLKLVKKFKPS
jgi:hypothetical protein